MPEPGLPQGGNVELSALLTWMESAEAHALPLRTSGEVKQNPKKRNLAEVTTPVNQNPVPGSLTAIGVG